jgi:xanthine dehydrogenase accessory factor
MNDWLDALVTLTEPSILVTVAHVEGSAPRGPGAKMVFTGDQQIDTIGGGHLELRAGQVAREMLSAAVDHPRLERFPLGPGLGQCCGGVVHLAFERIDARTPRHFQQLAQSMRSRTDCWRVLGFDDESQTPLVFRHEKSPHVDIDHERGTYLATDGQDRRWLIDACLSPRPHLVLFGAGHVGSAIVRALSVLPCTVTWVDERDDMFPAVLPSNVNIESTDIPEAVVDAAPAGSCFLVMTHSHALDQRLAEAILRRHDMAWFGLIGSKTKRMQFEHRLRERGIAAQRLADMVCPIGLPGIAGKEPAVIAASVAAQLLQVWEATARNPQAARPAVHSPPLFA